MGWLSGGKKKLKRPSGKALGGVGTSRKKVSAVRGRGWERFSGLKEEEK